MAGIPESWNTLTRSLSDAQLLLEIVDVAFPEGYGVAKRDDSFFLCRGACRET